MTRVKFCGLASNPDVSCAVGLGAGRARLLFYPPSPMLTVDQAIGLVHPGACFHHQVGLFVDATADVIRETFDRTRLNLVQYHGEETRILRSLGIAVAIFEAIRVRPDRCGS